MFVQTQDQQTFLPVLEYFVDRQCLPSWRLRRAELQFHNLAWVLSGRADFWRDGERLQSAPGDLNYMPRGMLRDAVTDQNDLMHHLSFNFQLCPPER